MQLKKAKMFLTTIAAAAIFASAAFGQSDSKSPTPLKEGDKAVDFELQSLGKKVKLSDNFGEDGKNVVVVFSRANW